MVRFAVLGPLTVDGGAGPTAMRAGLPRTLLAALLLDANTVVSTDRLSQALWGERPPRSATAALHNHSMRLRRQLGPTVGCRIRTEAPGYLVEVRDGEFDEQAFLDGCRQGREALQAGAWAAAFDTLVPALTLWRGDPYADLPSHPDACVHVQRLAEMRVVAWENRVEAALRLGRHQEVVPELRALLSAYPLRESLHGQLMLALYRSQQQAEALDVYTGLRRALVDELGIEPSKDIQELHRRILGADPTLGAPAAAHTSAAFTPAVPPTVSQSPPGTAAPLADGVVRYQLPSDTRVFTGRDDEIERLAVLAGEAPLGNDAGMVLICAIDGMGGVGKSALAVHAAHRMRHQFPDGQLFIDLHGHTEGIEPLTAADALDWLLRSLGVPPLSIPQDLQARAALYRHRLADTRTLIVLDNAASTAQVRFLLPGTSGCLVLVTSRKRLAGLDDAHTVALDVLQPHEAATLLHKAAGPGRIPADHPDVPELTALCGRMPLAIRIIGARLRHSRSLTVESLVEQLRGEHDRLDQLQDEDRSLGAVFESSYAALPLAEQQLFERLGLVPGADFDTCAAANLNGSDLASTERLLESLLDHNLLAQHAPGRYRFHDLLRLFARRLQDEDPDDGRREAAVGRLFDYYRYSARCADRRLARYTAPGRVTVEAPPVKAPELRDRAAALVWTRTEADNLLAAADAALGSRPQVVAELSSALASFLQQEGPWLRAVALHGSAVTAAREQHDRLGEANALWDLARVRQLTGDSSAAAELQEQALTLYRSVGDRLGEANALHELGRVRLMTADSSAAAELQEQAHAIYQHLGDRQGAANALWNLGRVRLMTADYPAATELQQQALAIFQELGDRLGEANALWDLGGSRFVARDLPAAADLQERALALYQDLGSRHGEANVLWDLGRVRQAAGDYQAATEMYGRALAIYQELGHRHGEANAVAGLGHVRQAVGDHHAAAERFEEALAIARDLGHRHSEAGALADLGRARRATGQHKAAAAMLEEALAIYQDIGDRQGETEALNSIAEVLAETDGPGEALVVYRRALDLARLIGSPLDEAQALQGAAQCAADTGDHAAASADQRQAVAILRQIDSPGATAAAEYLAALEDEEAGGLDRQNRSRPPG